MQRNIMQAMEKPLNTKEFKILNKKDTPVGEVQSKDINFQFN